MERKLQKKVKKDVKRQVKSNANARGRGKMAGGYNVTALPGSPNNYKAHTIPVHDKVQAWSDLMMNPFSANSEGVYSPISSKLIPDPSTKVRNYGTATVIVPVLGAGSVESINMWFWPEGTIEPGAAGAKEVLQGFSVGDLGASNTNQYGPILSNENASLGAAAGILQMHDTSFTGIAFTHPSAPLTTGVSLTESLPWDNLQNPFPIPDKTSDTKFRCTAFGLRVSYTGKLSDTEGYVDYYNPYKWSGTSDQPVDMNSLRRDPSHRRKYFSNKRTHTFVWHPNQLAESYADIALNASNMAACTSRTMLRIGGIQAGDVFEIEYIGFQEFIGFRAVSTNSASPVSKDIVHVSNAIPEMHGRMNGDAGKAPVSLAQHVAVQKAISAPPSISPVAGEDHESALSKVVKGTGTAIKVVSSLAPLLALL